jgi:hypothetical protein
MIKKLRIYGQSDNKAIDSNISDKEEEIVIKNIERDMSRIA